MKGVKLIKKNANKYAAIFDNAKNAKALVNNTNLLKNREIKAFHCRVNQCHQVRSNRPFQ